MGFFAAIALVIAVYFIIVGIFVGIFVKDNDPRTPGIRKAALYLVIFSVILLIIRHMV